MLINNKEYRPIPGFAGYAVSEDGEVYSFNRNRNIKIQKKLGTFPYYVACLNNQGVQYNIPVHRLVALAWVPLPASITTENVLGLYWIHDLVVDHIDGNKYNNHASNLRWCTYYENFHADNWDKETRNAKLKGNNNASGHKPSEYHRYIYHYKGKDYNMEGLTKELQCSKSAITEAFRKNQGLVRQKLLTRTEL